MCRTYKVAELIGQRGRARGRGHKRGARASQSAHGLARPPQQADQFPLRSMSKRSWSGGGAIPAPKRPKLNSSLQPSDGGAYFDVGDSVRDPSAARTLSQLSLL